MSGASGSELRPAPRGGTSPAPLAAPRSSPSSGQIQATAPPSRPRGPRAVAHHDANHKSPPNHPPQPQIGGFIRHHSNAPTPLQPELLHRVQPLSFTSKTQRDVDQEEDGHPAASQPPKRSLGELIYYLGFLLRRSRLTVEPAATLGLASGAGRGSILLRVRSARVAARPLFTARFLGLEPREAAPGSLSSG